MGVWLVMTSLGTRFSVLSWPTHLDSKSTNPPHSLLTTSILSLNSKINIVIFNITNIKNNNVDNFVIVILVLIYIINKL